MLLGIVTALSFCTGALICMFADAFSGMMWFWLLPVGFFGSFLVQAGLIFVFLLVAEKAIRLDKPQEKDDPFFRWFIQELVSALIILLRVKINTQGLEKTPKEGRFLLVCNHLNDVDPVVLLRFFRKNQLAFISKRENDQKFLVGKLMHKILCQPINRENDREALKTILKCIEIIKEDKASIAVFPEGYTSLDRKLHPFRSGVFKIAQKAKVPIVVCTVRNTFTVLPNAKRLRPSEVTLHLVDVIPAQELEGVTATDIGNRVHAMMAQDLGPENVLAENEENP